MSLAAFPEVAPTCTKCGGVMTPEICGPGMAMFEDCEYAGEHLHWRCACGSFGLVTACKDAKPEKRTRWFAAYQPSRYAFAEVTDDIVTWVVRDTGERVLDDMGASLNTFLMDHARRELTEAEAVALLTPKADPFAAFERLAEEIVERMADGANYWSGRLRDTIAEARKQHS